MVTLPILSAPPRDPSATDFVLAPWLDLLPAGNPDLMSLLPISDINGALERLPAAPGQELQGGGAVVALLMADPFLRASDAVRQLRAAGISGVANFPTVQLIDGETARAFASAGAGAAREAEMMAAFAGEGFAATGFARGLDAARMMLRSGVDTLVLHPGVALSDWRQRAASALTVSRACSVLRGETDTRILVYRPAGFGPELDQALAAADGEVRICG